jgi:hypothetical protein
MFNRHKDFKNEGAFGLLGVEDHQIQLVSFTAESGDILLRVDFARLEKGEGLVYMDPAQALRLAKRLQAMALKAFEDSVNWT